jgi:hypothetical protein
MPTLKGPSVCFRRCANGIFDGIETSDRLTYKAIQQCLSIPWLSLVVRSSIARVGNALRTLPAGLSPAGREDAARTEQRKILLALRLERVCALPHQAG